MCVVQVNHEIVIGVWCLNENKDFIVFTRTVYLDVPRKVTFDRYTKYESCFIDWNSVNKD